jgi:hypothetical protein
MAVSGSIPSTYRDDGQAHELARDQRATGDRLGPAQRGQHRDHHPGWQLRSAECAFRYRMLIGPSPTGPGTDRMVLPGCRDGRPAMTNGGGVTGSPAIVDHPGERP